MFLLFKCTQIAGQNENYKAVGNKNSGQKNTLIRLDDEQIHILIIVYIYCSV